MSDETFHYSNKKRNSSSSSSSSSSVSSFIFPHIPSFSYSPYTPSSSSSSSSSLDETIRAHDALMHYEYDENPLIILDIFPISTPYITNHINYEYIDSIKKRNLLLHLIVAFESVLENDVKTYILIDIVKYFITPNINYNIIHQRDINGNTILHLLLRLVSFNSYFKAHSNQFSQLISLCEPFIITYPISPRIANGIEVNVSIHNHSKKRHQLESKRCGGKVSWDYGKTCLDLVERCIRVNRYPLFIENFVKTITFSYDTYMNSIKNEINDYLINDLTNIIICYLYN